MSLNKVEDALRDLQQGKLIIVVDDEDRENEGDLVGLADFVTPEMINFMVTHGKGLVCAPITTQLADQLQLAPMLEQNTDQMGTAFTVSIDADGTHTGISAGERAETIRRLTDHHASPSDFRRPGHIFPLIAKDGGVLERRGHTEAVIDLARIAGAKPVGIICEILNPDGTMARLPQLEVMAREHDLKIISIEQLVQYRKRNELWIDDSVQIHLPNVHGDFQMVGFRNHFDFQDHVALVKGDPRKEDAPLVRIHSECLTGDVFGSKRCDCGEQLHLAIEEIERVGNGIILYMRQEGRGIGLYQKLRAYELQEQGYDTVEANHQLGFGDDLRDYLLAAQMLDSLGVKRIRLLTNNPEKMRQLEDYGMEVAEIIPVEVPPAEENQKYLHTKKEKMGHILSI